MKGLLQGVDGGNTYTEYMASRQRNDELEEKISRVKAQIVALEQVVTTLTINSTNPTAMTPRLVQLHDFVKDRRKALEDMVVKSIHHSFKQ